MLMKAVIHRKYGPPEVLSLTTLRTPKPKPTEVLVKIRHSTVTSGDTRLRGFKGAGLIFWLPMRLLFGVLGPRRPIVGMEFSGDVVGIGKYVTQFNIGDAVFGTQLRGSNAEYTAIKEDAAILKKPIQISYKKAVSLPFGSLAALVFLRDIAGLKKGESVLIIGASGNVGLFAVQLSKYFGANVTGVCSTANTDLVQSIGADHVIDYKKEDYTKRQNAYDLIFDAVGVASFWKSRKSLKKQGRFVTVGGKVRDFLLSFMTHLVGTKRLKVGISGDTKEDLAFIANLASRGKITSVIDCEFTLSKAVEAHRYVESGRKTGSVILNVMQG